MVSKTKRANLTIILLLPIFWFLILNKSKGKYNGIKLIFGKKGGDEIRQPINAFIVSVGCIETQHKQEAVRIMVINKNTQIHSFSKNKETEQ